MEFRRRQSMEAWRSGSDDLALPELAPLASELASDPSLRAECEALHAEQQLFRSALQDVAVPSGLADRLKAKLQLAPAMPEPALLADVDVVGPAAPGSSDAPLPASAREADAEAKSPSVRPVNRVRVLLGVASLACALLIPGILSWFSAAPLSRESLVAAALDLPAKEALREGEWRGDLDGAPIACQFPSKSFRQDVVPLGWRTAEGLVPGSTGAVYRLAGPRRAQAYLLVLQIPSGVVGLDVSLAIGAVRSTGGWVAGAWRDGDRVCLLLMEGTAERFRELLRPEASAA